MKTITVEFRLNAEDYEKLKKCAARDSISVKNWLVYHAYKGLQNEIYEETKKDKKEN